MTHAALVGAVLFWLVVLLTLLLVMFLYAVIATPPEDAVAAEAPALNPAGPAHTLPARRPQAPTSAAGAADRPGTAGYPARHTTAASPVTSPPKVSSGPQKGPGLAPILGIAGLAFAVIGGWLFLRTVKGATPCSHQAGAVCSQGFVVFTATQLLGGAMALVGITLVFTALYLALR